MGGDLIAAIHVAGEPGHPQARLDAEIRVPPGITVLFGPSGSGKTTCLVTLAGLLRPTRGRIALGGQVFFDSDLGTDVPPERRRVGLVFQSLALFPHLSAEANVAYGLPAGLSGAARRDRARHWLERIRVPHLAQRKPASFSGGEAQRVALARALASEPRVLLLDEPFSALDLELRLELAEEVQAIVTELGLPALLVTHDREDARRLGRRLILLSAGRVVSEGVPADVLG
ncbi:MAG: ATP-binding cassette domain-containing protein [Candidatus Sericytochromatia bacterium]|nr:ATP-binding cassette domain-containing protein [Candidatus Tanganyikabacteria bacterium]